MKNSEILSRIQWEARNTSLALSDICPVLNELQKEWIQPKARVQMDPITLSIVANTESYALSSLTNGGKIWGIHFMTEVISGKEYNLDPLLPEDDVESEGIRLWNGSLYVQPKPGSARTIKLYCYQILTDLDSANNNQVPDINAHFHDLYVLGYMGRYGRRQDELDTPEPRDYWGEFVNRLEALNQYQSRPKQQPVRRVIRPGRWR